MRTGRVRVEARRANTYLVLRTRVARVVPVVDVAFVADDREEVVFVDRLRPEGRVAVEKKMSLGDGAR